MPTYGPTQFKSVDPGSGEILIHFTGSGTSTDDTASQCNVSIEDCFGNNRTSDIANLTKITISNTAGTLIDLPLINGTAYSTHYNFDIDPDVYFPSESITTGSCLEVAFDPSPFIDFSSNEYNATLNNTEQDRTSAYIFNIDSQRSGSSSRPLNYQQIIDGTAVTASVQDSFYTDSGIINARFDGSETTKAQYGISPALAGNSFQGILFNNDTDDIQILSASGDTNLYRDFIFTLDENFAYAQQNNYLVTISGSAKTLTPNARYLLVNDTGVNDRAQVLGTSQDGFVSISGSATATHHHALADQKGRLFSNFNSFESGEPFLIKIGSINWEFIQSNGTFATDFGTISGSITHPFTQMFIQSGSRLYPSYDGNQGPFVSYNDRKGSNTHYVNSSPGGVFGDPLLIYKLVGDHIFEADNNQIAAVTDKKLLVVDTGDILYIDNRGQAIWNIGNININVS